MESVIAAVGVMMVSLVGALFTVSLAKDLFERNLSYLVSFSAGVFLVTSGALVLEVFELADSVIAASLLVVCGYALASLIQILLPETHHHHDAECHSSHRGARKLMIGDALHNIADGVILVTAFAVSPVLGLGVLASVIIHEALQEASEFFVLRKAGFSPRKALALNLLVSSTILIGVWIGHLALEFRELEVLLLAISAGFFIHVVWHDLLPKRHFHHNSRSFVKSLVAVGAGLLIMALIQATLKDEHQPNSIEDVGLGPIVVEAE